MWPKSVTDFRYGRQNRSNSLLLGLLILCVGDRGEIGRAGADSRVSKWPPIRTVHPRWASGGAILIAPNFYSSTCWARLGLYLAWVPWMFAKVMLIDWPSGPKINPEAKNPVMGLHFVPVSRSQTGGGGDRLENRLRTPRIWLPSARKSLFSRRSAFSGRGGLWNRHHLHTHEPGFRLPSCSVDRD